MAGILVFSNSADSTAFSMELEGFQQKRAGLVSRQETWWESTQVHPPFSRAWRFKLTQAAPRPPLAG